MRILPPVSIEARRLLPSRWDALAALLVLGFIVLFADASRSLIEPLSSLTREPLSLDPANLPGYALRTSMRMLIALAVSLGFTLTYATWAAKSQRAGSLLIPLLDPDPYPILASTQARTGGANVSGIQNPLLDKALVAARAPGTMSARLKAYRDLQVLLGTLQPMPTLFFRDSVMVAGSSLVGPVPRPVSDAAGRFWDVVRWDSSGR